MKNPLNRLALGVAAGALIVGAAIAAPRTESGRTLVVPAEHQSLGQTYYVHGGKDVQVTFTSDAAIEHIKGVSGQVVGYAVAPTDGSPIAGLLTGEFRLPVASIDTGIPLRNEHLQSGRWLNAADYPDVVFNLEKTENVKVSSDPAPAGVTVYTADLVGTMTIRDQTKPFRTTAKITAMPESDVTKRRAPGDILIIRANYPVNLREFGFNDPGMSAGMVADTVSIDTFLFLSTASPDRPRR